MLLERCWGWPHGPGRHCALAGLRPRYAQGAPVIASALQLPGPVPGVQIGSEPPLPGMQPSGVLVADAACARANASRATAVAMMVFFTRVLLEVGWIAGYVIRRRPMTWAKASTSDARSRCRLRPASVVPASPRELDNADRFSSRLHKPVRAAQAEGWWWLAQGLNLPRMLNGQPVRPARNGSGCYANAAFNEARRERRPSLCTDPCGAPLHHQSKSWRLLIPSPHHFHYASGSQAAHTNHAMVPLTLCGDILPVADAGPTVVQVFVGATSRERVEPFIAGCPRRPRSPR